MPAEVRGAQALRKALRKFEPDLQKEVQATMISFLKPIVQKARGYIPATPPLSRLDRGNSVFKYNAKAMRGGIGYRTTPSKANRRGFSYAASLINKTATGAIYETAGRKGLSGQPWVGPKVDKLNHKVSHSNNPNAGRQFITALGPLKGRKAKLIGRYMFKAWDEDQGRATHAIMKAIENSATKFKQRRGI
jgi:hypothetical protein